MSCIVKYLPLPNDIKNVIRTMICFDIWRIKIDRVNRQYHRTWKCIDFSFCAKMYCRLELILHRKYTNIFFNYRMLNFHPMYNRDLIARCGIYHYDIKTGAVTIVGFLPENY